MNPEAPIIEISHLVRKFGHADAVNDLSLRNLWPIDFAMYADYVGFPCFMKPAFGGGWKDVNKCNSIDDIMRQPAS